MLSLPFFIDPQDAVPGDFCPVCGGERYGLSFACLYCERRGERDDDGDQRAV